MPEPHRIVYARRARRDLDRLAPSVAWACLEFIAGALADNPRRVGKPLTRGRLAGRYAARRAAYRIVYAIDDDARVVEVLRVDHRADVYRP